MKGFNLLQKAILVLGVYFIVVSLFFYFTSPNKIKTNTDPIKKSRQQIYSVINDPKLNSTKNGRLFVGLYRNSMCALIGEACTNSPSDGDKNFDSSLFGYIAKGIVLPYANPPASGTYWVYTGLQNTGFVPKSFAVEGVGFAAIKPLSTLWKVFRDIAYFAIVLVLIAIGFMIMFRIKINPQTIISLENSLPRLVLALLLITFSFAIAGFLIDLMYVVAAIMISLIGKNTIINVDIKSFQGDFFSGSGWNLLNRIFFNADILNVGPAIFSILPSFVGTTVRLILVGLATWFLTKSPAAPPPASDAVEGTPVQDIGGSGGLPKTLMRSIIFLVLTPVLGFLAPYILSLVILITTGLLVFFRIFFLLFAAYIRIIIYIIFAPIYLLLEAVPGTKAFNNWIKNLIADLLVFPLVIVLILVSHIVVNSPVGTNVFWQPPFLYTQQPQAFNILVGIGILFMIPNFIKAIKKAMGIKESGLRFGLGTFFAGAGAGLAGGTRMLQQYGSLAIAMPGLRRLISKRAPGFLREAFKADEPGTPAGSQMGQVVPPQTPGENPET